MKGEGEGEREGAESERAGKGTVDQSSCSQVTKTVVFFSLSLVFFLLDDSPREVKYLHCIILRGVRFTVLVLISRMFVCSVLH